MGKLVNIRSSAEFRPPRPVQAGKPAAVDLLNTEAALKRLRQLEEWLEVERIRQAPNRYQMALDADFYDGLQWSDEDAAVLLERGQAPLVYNWIQPAVKWVTGTEKRTRIDFKVYPRSDDDRNESENKTKLMKYLTDVNKSVFSRSRAFEDAVKVGIGWLECGIRSDPTKELIFDRYESWRNVLYDSFGFDRDLADARYVIRQKWVDLDIAEQIFPHKAEALRSASVQSDLGDYQDADEWYLGQLLTSKDRQLAEAVGKHTYIDSTSMLFNRRERVKIYEMWYRMPERMTFLVGGPLAGAIFDPNDDYHSWLVQREACSMIERVAMRMRCGIFIKGTFLQDVPSPYRHNDFPFTPIWGNRRDRDGQPYGMPRLQRDPQEDFNKRMSKALHALSTRRVFMDRGAVDDIDEVREEAARPDSVFVVKPGMRFELDTDTQVAKDHMSYAEVDARMIQNTGGVTDELMGRKTNAISGVAIEARQDQGSTVTTDYFDNLRFATQVHGQKMLSLSEQFLTMTKKIRVIGERRGYDFLTINEPGTDESGNPALLNDITKTQADFIVSAQDFRESMRQASFEVLMDLAGKLAGVDPMITLKLLDDILEYADLPGAEAIIQTIREITGKQPRDKQLSPEEEAQIDAEKRRSAAKAKLAEHLSLKQAALEVQRQAAEIEKLRADAAKVSAEANMAGMGAEIRMQYEEKVAKLREDTGKLVDQFREQVLQLKNDASTRNAEIDRKYATDLIKAREERASRREIAELEQNAENERHAAEQATLLETKRLEANTQTALDGVKAQFADLQRMIEDAQKVAEEAGKRADEAEDAAEEAAKRADEAVREADARVKEVEKASRETEKAIRDEMKAEREERKAEKEDKDEKEEKAQPPQPIVIAMPSDEGMVKETKLDVETSASGMITGVKVTTMKKRPGKKREPK
jgi:hypothetical protein